MNGIENITPAAEAFTRQSSRFDGYESENEILRWMRGIVHKHMKEFIRPGDRLLDLNAGTGIDAIFFAQHGVSVHAIDISPGMIRELRSKVARHGLHNLISTEERSFMDLDGLQGKFDHIFSNFGGLNCVADPEPVFRQFKYLLKPGGLVSLVVMPPICPWEILQAAKGNFHLAFRRLRRKGTDAYVEGIKFTTYYFGHSELSAALGNDYHVIARRGLAALVPPPYLENFPRRFPSLCRALENLEEKVSTLYPFNSWADHLIITSRFQP